MRLTISLDTMIVGVVLGIVTYFFLTAPLGSPMDEGFSNPRVPFAATIFVVAVIIVFASAVIYELFPGGGGD